MIKESKVNLESKTEPFLLNEFYVYDMTVPLRPVKSEQLCYEPEPLVNQFEKIMLQTIEEESLIRNFRLNYATVYQAFILEQRKNLLDFIKVYLENHKDSK